MLLTPPTSSGVKYLSMMEGEDWLFRPVMRGLVKGESLFDCTLNLEQIALFNEAIDVMDENTARARRAITAQKR